MNTSNCVGGVLGSFVSPSGNYRYYLIQSFGERECYSLFCQSSCGEAFYFDVCREREQALHLAAQLAEGEVSPFFLDEVLEEL